jgi:hypothetical protein
METNPERCLRLLVAVETLVEEECFAATRGDWEDVLTVQMRVDPLLQGLGALLADGAIPAAQKERVAPRLRILQRQQGEILAHIKAHKARLASRLAAADAAAGRVRGMKKAYGPTTARGDVAPTSLRESA